jgi:hypothetical protein
MKSILKFWKIPFLFRVENKSTVYKNVGQDTFDIKMKHYNKM